MSGGRGEKLRSSGESARQRRRRTHGVLLELVAPPAVDELLAEDLLEPLVLAALDELLLDALLELRVAHLLVVRHRERRWPQ